MLSSMVTTPSRAVLVREIVRFHTLPSSSVYSSTVSSGMRGRSAGCCSPSSSSIRSRISSSTVSAAASRALGKAPLSTKAAPVRVPAIALPALITIFFTSADSDLSRPVLAPCSISASSASPSGLRPIWKLATMPALVSVVVKNRATGSYWSCSRFAWRTLTSSGMVIIPGPAIVNRPRLVRPTSPKGRSSPVTTRSARDALREPASI